MIKVLVIDDDLISRKTVVQAMEETGRMVIQSSNGKHGWETLWENPDINLVITDIMMPDMDGRELLYIIRGNQQFEKLPVLLVSGVSDEAELGALVKLGGPTKYLRKPLDRKLLLAAAAELLTT